MNRNSLVKSMLKRMRENRETTGPREGKILNSV